MKILHIASLAGLLWLTGCATTGPTPSDQSAQSGKPSSGPTTPSSHTPVIPNGPLRPITAAQASSGEVASLSAPADLWDRIRRGFAMPDLQHELVQDREQW
ncbi:MAG: lytic transglycosylase, partial [Acidovorax sp.]|nr:lytic transglycosylase [Acidovorax sp.]